MVKHQRMDHPANKAPRNTPSNVTVRELAGHGFDSSPYRPPTLEQDVDVLRAHSLVEARLPWSQHDPTCAELTAAAEPFLAPHRRRTDLLAEMHSLVWSLGIVDLRHLLAFQRRLVLPFGPALPAPAPDDWTALARITLPPPTPPEYRLIEHTAHSFVLESENPNLQLNASPATPLSFTNGSPFVEAAEHCGRWFLRDGYHRAFQLLHAGISRVPAVLIRARTLAELGPIHPWFFPEEILFGPHPPRLTDFLDDILNIEYSRPRLRKRIHVTMEETLVPAAPAQRGSS